MSQKFSVDAEIAESPSFIVDDTVAFTGNRNQAWKQAVFWSFEGSEQISSDCVDEARALCRVGNSNGHSCYSHKPTTGRPEMETNLVVLSTKELIKELGVCKLTRMAGGAGSRVGLQK